MPVWYVPGTPVGHAHQSRAQSEPEDETVNRRRLDRIANALGVGLLGLMLWVVIVIAVRGLT